MHSRFIMAYGFRLLAAFWVATNVISLAFGLTFPHTTHADTNKSSPFEGLETGFVNRQQAKVPLRILSLGASIMWGHGSSTGNGYVRTGNLGSLSITI
jgi:hypothetical protein